MQALSRILALITRHTFAIPARLTRTCRLALVVLLATAGLWSAPAGAESADNPKAREAWMSGYLKLEEATKAEENSNQVAALELYREAVQVFVQVRAKYPAWNQTLLDYRISYCNERVKALESILAARNVTLNKEELVALSKNQDARIKTLTAESAELTKKLEMNAAALERARGEAARSADSDAALARLTKENKALQDSLQAARVREERLQADSEALKSTAGLKLKAERLQQTLDIALTRQAEAEKAGSEYKNALRGLTDQLRTASLEREKAEAEVTALKKSAATQAATAKTQQAQLDERDKRGAELQKELATATAKQEGGKAALEQAEKLNQSLAATVAELKPYREKAAALAGEVQTAQDATTQARDEVRKLQTTVQKTADDLAVEQKKRTAVEVREQELTAQLAELRKQTAKDVSKHTEQTSELENNLDQMGTAAEKEIARITAELKNARAALAQAKTDRELLKTALANAREDAAAAAAARPATATSTAAPTTTAPTPATTAKAGATVPAAEELRDMQFRLRVAADKEAELNQQLVEADTRAKAQTKQLAAVQKRADLVDGLEKTVREKNSALDAAARQAVEQAETRAALLQARADLDALKTKPSAKPAPETAKPAGTDTGDLPSRLRAAEARQFDLAEQLAEARKHGAMAKELEKSLRQKEQDLEKLRVEVTTATTQLGERSRELAAAQVQNTTLAAEQARTSKSLDALQQNNRNVTKDLEALKLEHKQALAKARESDTKVEAVSKQLDELKKGQSRETALAEQARLQAQRQDDQIAVLEKQLATARADLAVKDKVTTALQLSLDQAKAAANTPPSEHPQTAGIATDTAAVAAATVAKDKELDASIRMRQTAESERDAARKSVDLLQVQLAEARRQLDDHRQALRLAQQKAAPASDPLLDELRTVTRQLDQERTKTTALEQALATATQAPAAPAPAADPLNLEEKRQRDQDRELMCRNLLQQAVTAEGASKPEAAVFNYKKVLELQPANKTALKRVGMLAARLNNDEDAERYLRRAFYADPDDVEVLNTLGFVLVRQSKADLAVSMLARGVALRPEDPGLHRAFGVACSSLGWMDAAEVQFRRALEMNGKDGEAAFNLAVLLAAKKPARLEEAKNWYKKARTLGLAADPGLDKLFAQ